MQINIRVFVIATVLFFASCETFVEIDVPPIDKKPVLNCLFTENQAFRIRLMMSSDIDDTVLVFIKNARINLFANNKFIEQLHEQDSGRYVSDYIAQRNIRYRVEAHIEGFPAVIASDSLPDLVNPEKVYYQKNAIYDYGSNYTEANIVFYDPEVPNYYELNLSAKYTYYADWDGNYHEMKIYDNIAYWLIDDPALNTEDVTGWIGSVSFNDEQFNGKKYTLKLPVHEMPDNAKHFVTFNSVSYHYYKYKTTMDRHFFNQGGWTYDELLLVSGGNPVQMYSNVENGYGIFAGYISQTFEVNDIRE